MAAMIARPSMPPTTPPAMAPALLEPPDFFAAPDVVELSSLEAVVLTVSEEVAVLVPLESDEVVDTVLP